MRVLTISTNISAGHQRAAEAVAQAILAAAPQTTISSLDAVELMGRRRRHCLTRTYLGILRHVPRFWNFLYHQRGLRAPVELVARAFLTGVRERFAEAVTAFAPDVIVCTQAIPARILAELKREGRFAAPILAVATDYGIHPYWADPGIDRYAVPCAEAREELIWDGVERARIRVTGIPVHSIFQTPPTRSAARAVLGLPGEGALILVMGGGNGLGVRAEDMMSLERIPGVSGVILIAGCNERLMAEALACPRVPGVERIVKATVTGIEHYYAACDLLVSKPGGLTMSEATAMGVPIVMVGPLPGQEVRNADFLERAGAAMRARSTAEMTGIVFRLLSDRARIDELARGSRAVGRPAAARDIARMVLALADETAPAVSSSSVAPRMSALAVPLAAR